MDEEIEIKYKQAAITPFWRKLPFFFAFPFRFGPLIFMACIVGASALAGLALGAFSLVFRGLLVYLGLRYAFNVLELFSRGRFEGESMDHRLWGPEKRPAKLGAVIALFIAVGAALGNLAVENRLANDTAVQDRLVARYQKEHAAELEQLAREREAFNKRIGLASEPAPTAPLNSEGEEQEGNEPPAASAPAVQEAAQEPPPAMGLSRAEIVAMYKPEFGDPLWFSLQPAWFWLVMVVVSLLLPAAAVVIALEDNFWRALNPLNVTHLMGAMGAAYFVLWGFFLAIAGSRHAVMHTGANWPAALRFPVEMGIATYLGLVLFAIMGYALYQFHQELHLDVDVDFDEHREAGGAEAIAQAGSARAALQKSAGPQDPWERKLHDLVAAGNFKEAIAEVRDRMRYDRFDVPLNNRLHALYLKQGDAQATLAHGQQLLTALARGGAGRELLDAVRKLQALDPTFQPEDGDAVLPAATAAFQQRDFALTTSLLRSFDKRFPKHKDTAGVFFLGARLLSEQNRQHDKALKLLRAVLHHFPDHAVAPEVKVYVKVLENMQGSAATA